MLRKILRKTQNASGQRLKYAVRGGGWDRPDVPLNTPYEHRRKFSLWDLNLWFQEDFQPEYILSNQEAYIDHVFGGATGENWRILHFFLGGGLILIGLMYYNDSIRPGYVAYHTPERGATANLLKTYVEEKRYLGNDFYGSDIDEHAVKVHKQDLSNGASYGNDFQKSQAVLQKIYRESEAFVNSAEADALEKAIYDLKVLKGEIDPKAEEEKKEAHGGHH